MLPEAWRARLGDAVWTHIVGDDIDAACLGSGVGGIADLLDRACEVGFTAPLQPPTGVRNGRAVLWGGAPATLTAEGLIAYYAAKGIAFALIRLPQLIRAHRGPLLPRLQEMFLGYEEQCEVEGLPPLPTWAEPLPFIGGRSRVADFGYDVFIGFANGLLDETPPATERVERVR